MSKKPNNSTIICLVVATFIAGVVMYAAWLWVNQWIGMPDWVFFAVYSLAVPTMGFYEAVYWGYWMAKTDDSL